MDTKFILQISLTALTAALTGGAFGSLITILYDRWKGRVPAIRYSLQQDKIFSNSDAGEGLNATVTVTENDEPHHLYNVSLVKLYIKNLSRIDYPTFSFGVTLPNEHSILKSDYASKDRYHKLECEQSPSPANKSHVLDFVCTPFNRNDDIRVTFYVSSLVSIIEKGQIQVATAAPVKFVSGSEEGVKPEPSVQKVAALGILVICLTTLSFMSGLALSLIIPNRIDRIESRIKELEEKSHVNK